MTSDIRWIQRFSNYKKAFAQLSEFIAKDELNKFERQGLIQCFEYTFELAWKTMKDYLEEQGYDAGTPRRTVQLAFRSNLVSDGHLWIDALAKRNLMAHTYEENRVLEAEKLIRTEYFQMMKALYFTLEGLQ